MEFPSPSRKKERVCYEDISTTDITIPPILIQGTITRSRARQIKQQVNSFLCSSSCENENRLLPNDVLVLRNEAVAAPLNLTRFKCDNPSPEGLESSRTSNGLK